MNKYYIIIKLLLIIFFMENINTIKNKETFVTQQKEKIVNLWNKINVLTTWNKIILFWWYAGLSYFLMVWYIMPLFNKVFLIATWWKIIIFYWIILALTILFTIINNLLLKILIYLFK